MILQHAYNLLLEYRYELLLPIAIFEGPIIIVIAGFLASIGVFDVHAVYAVAVIGDVIGDTAYYWIGRVGRENFLPKYGKYVGLTEPRIEKLENHFEQHFLKTILLFKFTQVGIASVLMAAGAAKVDFKKYMLVAVGTALVKGLIFTAIGYYFGSSYVLLGNYLHDYVIAATIFMVAAVIGYVLYRLYRKNYE